MAASRFSMAGTAQSCVIMDGRELTLEQPLRGSGADITCNKIGMIPSILITHGFCFLDGKRTEWNKLPSWLAHDDDLGITSADEPKSIQPQSCENEPTREGDTSKTVHEGELRQEDPSDAVASLSATSPLAPEDQAETDLRMSSVEADPSVAESTEAQFPCTICERNFKSKIGLGQHERHAHPDLRNTHRIQNVKQNKERKRVNRTRIEEVGSNTDKKPKSKPRGVWSEDEVKKLQALCEELAGTKNINKAIALHLPGKTNKQVSDKRKSLKDACKSKPYKGVTDHVATGVPLPTKAREQLTPEALLEQYTAEVCDKGAEETFSENEDESGNKKCKKFEEGEKRRTEVNRKCRCKWKCKTIEEKEKRTRTGDVDYQVQSLNTLTEALVDKESTKKAVCRKMKGTSAPKKRVTLKKLKKLLAML
ncbi:Hypothetical predicted protein [Mytilus galloprovincialis]|uniref:C2H2-type domain-containing protein n=1 Tax=Mytilus galloprovincialis TaxID=29158 RepID=A0A8B6HND0_MYTGA|nr:Hypothetical predicted protein [Mytilus galloprovincialis]